ncbi:MAG: hypothetical protein LBR69_02485 [Endomicrobium sp.]|jgi:hypothetical protein|nr:hypothetical protein [Endomicrobium sp.]
MKKNKSLPNTFKDIIENSGFACLSAVNAEDPDYSLLKFSSEEYKYYNGQFEAVSGKI